jgi:hypothetical protein
MAWETRGARPYYYRSVRNGNKVRKVYLGSGHLAKRAARQDAKVRAKRAADEEELAELQTRLAGLDQLGEEVQHGVDLLTEATLLSLGFHEHRGEWRLHRG